jgi:hypothetical protein
VSLRLAFDGAARKAADDPAALRPALVQAHDLGRDVVTALLTAGPVLGQVGDAHTTNQALREFPGQLSEGNPLAKAVGAGGWEFYLVKGLMGGAVSFGAWLLRRKHRDREAAILSVLGTAVGAAPALLNRATIKGARER